MCLPAGGTEAVFRIKGQKSGNCEMYIYSNVIKKYESMNNYPYLVGIEIITTVNDQDEIGIVLFGTEDSSNSLQYENVKVSYTYLVNSRVN